MKVKIIKKTRWNNAVLSVGAEIDVDSVTGKRWQNSGIADAVKQQAKKGNEEEK